MKHYRKTYEDVFSTDRPKSKTRLNLDQISVGEMGLDEYTSTFKSFIKSFYTNLFDDSVKLSWLRRNFSYYGKKTVLPMHKNSRLLNSSFVKFLRRNVGRDIQVITKGKFFSKLELYFDEMFPDFDEGIPFEYPVYYKNPFDFVSVDFGVSVYSVTCL